MFVRSDRPFPFLRLPSSLRTRARTVVRLSEPVNNPVSANVCNFAANVYTFRLLVSRTEIENSRRRKLDARIGLRTLMKRQVQEGRIKHLTKALETRNARPGDFESGHTCRFLI